MLTTLQSFPTCNCENITDAGLAHLKGLTKLQTLDISDCKNITDAGLVHLEDLTNLETLDLMETQTTDSVVAELQKALPNIETWPKLFQNLRASCSTELAQEFPAHVAAAWIGHSVEIANKHYWQVTDDDFARAVGKTKAAQNPAQQVHAGPRRGSQVTGSAYKETTVLQGSASSRETSQTSRVGPAGFEPTTKGL